MMLLKVHGSNVKGRTFSYALGPATAIVGGNFEGKSSITDAIRLALMGYLPEVGKRPASTWELSSGAEMEVVVQFDDKTEVRRQFRLEGTTVKVAVQCREEVGFFEDLPLLNAEAYFGMTDSQRTAYVFERVKLPDSYTPAAIISECERISFEEEHTEQVQKAKGELIRDVQEAFECDPVSAKLDALHSQPPLPKPSVQQALSDALDTFRERFTYWNARAKATQGAVTTLAELKLRSQEATMAAQGVDQEIKKAQGELDRLNGEKGKLEAQQQEAERTAARKKSIRRELDADRTDYPRMIQKLRTAIETDQKKLGRELEPKARENLVESISESRDTLSRLNAGLDEQERIIEKAQTQLENLSSIKCCPWCKSKGKGWQDNLVEELTATVSKARDTKAAGEETRSSLSKSLKNMEGALEEADKTASANSKLRLTLESFAAEIKRHETSQATEAARREQLEAELDGLNVLPEYEGLNEQESKLRQNSVDARQVISELQAKKDAETRLQQELKLAAQSELEHADAAAHVLVVKTVAKLLKGKREAMIEEAFGGLLAIANKVTDGILKRQLALFENTIGMWDEDGKFIPHRVFSGTEKALTYIAIAVALSSTAPLKLVILDEFGRLDEGNQSKVMSRLMHLLGEEVIDQFIVVGTTLPETFSVAGSKAMIPLETIEL